MIHRYDPEKRDYHRESRLGLSPAVSSFRSRRPTCRVYLNEWIKNESPRGPDRADAIPITRRVNLIPRIAPYSFIRGCRFRNACVSAACYSVQKTYGLVLDDLCTIQPARRYASERGFLENPARPDARRVFHRA